MSIIMDRLHHFLVWRAIHQHITKDVVGFPDINTNAAANNIGFYTRHGYLIRNLDPKGSFQCAIPMRHIFGFVDDYSQMTYGMRDTLQLIRKTITITAAAGAGKVVLSKLVCTDCSANRCT